MNEELRVLFPVTKNRIYLNHAAASPVSIPVFERMRAYTLDILEYGHSHWREWGVAIEQVREKAARFVNAEPHSMAFAPNTSSGLSMIANGIEWRRGDNIVTADCEFPANLIPWLRLEREFGVEVRMAREAAGRIETEELLSLVDERTRVVTLSFVEYASGFRNDLKAIGRFCRDRDVLFIVDAIQGLGAIKLDVIRDSIDAFSADAHKFLLGPDGAALLYLGPRALERIKPTVVGWMSVETPFSFSKLHQDFYPGARRFEPGTLATAGVLGLGAAIDLFTRFGIDALESYLIELGDYLTSRLLERGYEVISSRRAGEKSAIISCTHPGHDAGALCHQLEAKGIITTARMGRLRISPHFYNTREDIDRLIEALP